MLAKQSKIGGICQVYHYLPFLPNHGGGERALTDENITFYSLYPPQVIDRNETKTAAVMYCLILLPLPTMW